jgi:hypothetical protein
VEEADLAEHRADAAHLEHQPLDGFVTAGRVLGSNWPVFSARYSRIAPDSNSGSGLPSGPLGSMMAGILLFGFSDRNSGDSWSLVSKLTSAAHRPGRFPPARWKPSRHRRRQQIQLEAFRMLGRPLGGDRKGGQVRHGEPTLQVKDGLIVTKPGNPAEQPYFSLG